MVDLGSLLNVDSIFIYSISFIVLLTLLFELLNRMKIFGERKINMFIALIITIYVFVTNGNLIISKILSLSTFGMVILFGLLIVLIIIFRFLEGAKTNWPVS